MVNEGDCEWWYTGEWKNDLAHGVGSVFNKTQNYLLVGLFLRGKLSLKDCRKIMGTGSYYIGALNEFYEAEGKGTMYYKDGSKYSGNFIGGIPNGEGKLITLESEFSGNF